MLKIVCVQDIISWEEQNKRHKQVAKVMATESGRKKKRTL